MPSSTACGPRPSSWTMSAPPSSTTSATSATTIAPPAFVEHTLCRRMAYAVAQARTRRTRRPRGRRASRLGRAPRMGGRPPTRHPTHRPGPEASAGEGRRGAVGQRLRHRLARPALEKTPTRAGGRRRLAPRVVRAGPAADGHGPPPAAGRRAGRGPRADGRVAAARPDRIRNVVHPRGRPRRLPGADRRAARPPRRGPPRGRSGHRGPAPPSDHRRLHGGHFPRGDATAPLRARRRELRCIAAWPGC